MKGKYHFSWIITRLEMTYPSREDTDQRVHRHRLILSHEEALCPYLPMQRLSHVGLSFCLANMSFCMFLFFALEFFFCRGHYLIAASVLRFILLKKRIYKYYTITKSWFFHDIMSIHVHSWSRSQRYVRCQHKS